MNTKRSGLLARLFITLALIVVQVLIPVRPALALFTPSDGQAATLVLGQPDFTSNTFTTTQTGMHGPTGIAVDPTSGKIFVADCDNNRILRFASAGTVTNGAAAEAVLGQPDFTSNTANTTRNGMSCPDQISIDSTGRLWVADFYNSRVLRFDTAASKANGADADGVLGQPDFTTSDNGATQNGMNFPDGVFADSGGRVWVGDSGNNRVLRFDNAAAKADGANADGVLGQPDFTSGTSATTQTGMFIPVGVSVDSSGRLWVVESSNHRVLRFDNAAAKANGASADGVLGQQDFTSNALATTQSGMQYPTGVAMDETGRLYVSEGQFNNRILVFENAATLANGADASNVLGQSDFTTGTPNTGGISAATLSYPYQLFYDPAAKVLWVAEYFNHRVLMYGTLDITSPSTRYVATTGIDFGNCGNSASPCRTITYAISQAVAGNTIEIAAGTYTEAGITIDKDLTLTGAGATSTIVQAATSPGTASDRVFFINNSVTATLEGMTIRNGKTTELGGGLLNNGMLTLNNSTVSGNAASVDGGGISNLRFSTLTLNNSTISDNTAIGRSSGGIYNEATVTLNNSTVSGNSAKDVGGGIFNNRGTLTLNYSTMANNISDSDNNGFGDGGGLFNNTSGTVNLKSSIVAGNRKGTSGTSDATADCGGTMTSQGYNLTGSSTGCNLSGIGDVNVTPGNVFTDVLGALANNGGATQTHALIVSLSNPALNAIPSGTNRCGSKPFNFDQRGEARPFNTNCDIGAYEAQSAPVSPQDGTELVINDIQDLIDMGLVSSGNGNALISKLDSAIQALDAGNITSGVNKLNSFINQVNALINSGALTLAEGQALIDAAQAIIDSIV